MRASKDQYYLDIAKQVAERSTCFRAKGGSIIVKGDQIISAGYIGAPRKTKDCFERGNCLRDELKIPHGQRYELCRSVHAEMNAIINAARSGASLFGGDLYLHTRDRNDKVVTTTPCFFCKRMIINAGIDRVICSADSKEGLNIFKVTDWVKEWQEKDIIDDKQQYGNDMNERDNFK
jgi:dCMP deaminase